MTLNPCESIGVTLLTSNCLLDLKANHVTSRAELDEPDGENVNECLSWLERRPKPCDVLTEGAA